jgi:hypothetical protein
MDRHFFKYEEYDLAVALFKAGVSLYAYGLGPFGEHKGRVISFDVADIEIDEEEFCAAEDLCRPVVFNRDVGQGTCNALEWERCIGDLYCSEEDYQKYVVKSLERIVDEIGNSPIPLNIVIEHLKKHIA